jgi:diguanylate cyclase (GGDEF)-like protein
VNVLIVDDDKVDRELIKRSLHKSELQVLITEAFSVDEGLTLYKEKNFDIVLLDCRLPQRDGIEMIIEIKNEPKENSTAFVMMSSSEDEQLALDCIKAGAQDFLVKSEITSLRLRRAVLQAQIRFELERELYTSYQKVKTLAESDSLTGLANRYLFDESLKMLLVNSGRSRYKLALLLIDLDNFKYVNDTYGHDVGDILLKKVVTRIKGCLRGNELFARLGGDEFAIALSNLEYVEHASRVALRIVRSLSMPFEIANATIQATASIGIAIHPDDGDNSEEIFKHADIAMYRAKKLGKSQFCFFEQDMQTQFSRRVLLENELKSAVELNQLELLFQPVINSTDESVRGFEALLRWHVNGQVRMPDEFILISEESKEIIGIGRWVIEESLRTLSQWNKKYKTEHSMAINISPVQLSDSSLCDFIEIKLKEFSISSHLIEIELTETALLNDTDEAHIMLSALHDLGCRIALDDFGTGYSSVSYLQKFPIDTVKIDKSIIPDNAPTDKSLSLLRGLVSMAQILGMNIIAEGVESKENVELCKSLGIKSIQGYYYCMPLSKISIEQNYLTIPHK